MTFKEFALESLPVGKLKAEFSSIIARVQKSGESFVVEYGRKRQKVAIIIPYDEAYEQSEDREFGIFEGKASYKISKDFEMSDEDLLGS